MTQNQKNKESVNDLMVYYQKEITEKLKKIDPNLVAELRFAINRAEIPDLAGELLDYEGGSDFYKSVSTGGEFGRSFTKEIVPRPFLS